VLSRRVARGDMAAAREILSHSTRMILFVMLPASFGLMLLSRPITRLLFVRGAFDAGASLDTTASVILFLSVGLFAYGGVKGAIQVFYSLKDTRTPVTVAAISLLVNVALNALLMRPLGAGGLALASSISSIVNMGLLLHLLRKRIGRLDGRAMAVSTARIVAASAVMCAAAWAVYTVLGASLPEERFVSLAARLALAIAAALVTYVGAASILRMDELAHLKSALGRRVKGPQARS
jgi:putative peptidoglycan lipid II flippase